MTMATDKFYRNLAIVAIALLAVVVLYRVRSLLTPVFAALLVAYILYPLVKRTHRYGVPKGLTVSILIVGMFGILVQLGFQVIPAVNDEVAGLLKAGEKKEVRPGSGDDAVDEAAESQLIPIGIEILEQLKEKTAFLPQEVDSEEVILSMVEWLGGQASELFTSMNAANAAREVLMKVISFMLIFFFVLSFALMDGDKLYKSVVKLIPNSFFEQGVFILNKTITMLGGYLRGLVVEGLLMTGVSFVLLFIVVAVTEMTALMALTIAVIIGVTNAIRIIGPIIGAALGVVLMLTSTPDLGAVVGILIVAFAVQILDNALILPLVMQGQTNVHPVFCLLGVLAGGILAGVMGMIMAIPVIGGVQIVYRVTTVEMKTV
jgi:predicted PurR-regulated permease PerM